MGWGGGGVRTNPLFERRFERICLKVPPQFDFFARFISNSFCENANLPSIHCTTCLFVFAFFNVVFVKSPDKLLHYLILHAEFIEVKMETLKTHEFRPW